VAPRKPMLPTLRASNAFTPVSRNLRCSFPKVPLHPCLERIPCAVCALPHGNKILRH
jgi:hypothetical protein